MQYPLKLNWWFEWIPVLAEWSKYNVELCLHRCVAYVVDYTQMVLMGPKSVTNHRVIACHFQIDKIIDHKICHPLVNNGTKNILMVCKLSLHFRHAWLIIFRSFSLRALTLWYWFHDQNVLKSQITAKTKMIVDIAYLVIRSYIFYL